MLSIHEVICTYTIIFTFWYCSGIQEKNKQLYEIASYEILSERKPVIVSDCKERGSNLVDGTDSEWWTESQNACIEIDLQYPCFIKDVKIKWWGTSVSSNVIISALEPDREYIHVRTSEDAIETPTDMNGWSRFDGWDIPTQKIKLELRDGCLDPWGMNKHFGIRQLIVGGRKVRQK